MKATVRFNYVMNITCPYCGHEFDLVDFNDDGLYSEPIFSNKWDDLKDESVDCPNCDKEFYIEGVVY